MNSPRLNTSLRLFLKSAALAFTGIAGAIAPQTAGALTLPAVITEDMSVTSQFVVTGDTAIEIADGKTLRFENIFQESRKDNRKGSPIEIAWNISLSIRPERETGKVVFENNQRIGINQNVYGGAIDSSHSNLILTNAVFKNNSLSATGEDGWERRGGAISAGGKVILNNVEFLGNWIAPSLRRQ